MPYTSLQALTDLAGESTLVDLTDRADPRAGVIDMSVLNRALERTDAVIDASLAVRYQLPLVAVPEVVAEIALSIAFYKLHRYACDQKVKDDYDQALKDLGDLSAGRKKLDVAGIEPVSSGSNDVVASDRPRDFTPDNLRGFI